VVPARVADRPRRPGRRRAPVGVTPPGGCCGRV